MEDSNMTRLESTPLAANRIKAELRATEQHKKAQPAKPTVRMPYVNYATGRLVW